MEHFMNGLRNYATFRGRTSRKGYWMYYLFYILFFVAASVVDGILGTAGVLGGLFVLAMFIPTLAIGIRRLHDINRSGWWCLIPIVPIVGIIVLLVFLVTKSVDEGNRFNDVADPVTA